MNHNKIPESFLDEGTYGNQSHTVFNDRIFSVLATVDESFSNITMHPCMREAILSATMIRNIAGDTDAQIADSTEDIRNALTTFALEVRVNPAVFILSIARTMPKEKALPFVEKCTEQLTSYILSLTANTKEQNSDEENSHSEGEQEILRSISSI